MGVRTCPSRRRSQYGTYFGAAYFNFPFPQKSVSAVQIDLLADIERISFPKWGSVYPPFVSLSYLGWNPRPSGDRGCGYCYRIPRSRNTRQNTHYITRTPPALCFCYDEYCTNRLSPCNIKDISKCLPPIQSEWVVLWILLGAISP